MGRMAGREKNHYFVFLVQFLGISYLTDLLLPSSPPHMRLPDGPPGTLISFSSCQDSQHEARPLLFLYLAVVSAAWPCPPAQLQAFKEHQLGMERKRRGCVHVYVYKTQPLVFLQHLSRRR